MSPRIWLALAALVCAPAGASAHERGLSQAEIRVGDPRITVVLVFARAEIVELVPGADADRSGRLDEIELLSVETALSQQVLRGVEVAARDAACVGAIDRVAFVEEDGLSIAADFLCPTGPAPLDLFTLRLPLLARLAPGHRLVGRVVFQDMSSATGIPELDFVAHRRRAALTIRRPDPHLAEAPEPSQPADPEPPRPTWPWLTLAAAVAGLGAVFVLRRRRA